MELATKKSWWCSSSWNASIIQIQKEPMFQFKSKLKQSGRRNSLLQEGQLIYFIQDFKWGGYCALLSLLIQMLTSSKNTPLQTHPE